MIESLENTEQFFNILQNDCVIVSVPLSRNRQKRRGYNHSALLGRYVAQYYSVGFTDEVLLRIRDTKPQYELSRRERFTNMVGAFSIKKTEISTIQNKVCIIVDDIATTCSTLQECAKVLKKNGAKEVWGVVFAREG